MKTRISVRWPRNCSVIGTSQEFVAERRAEHDGADAARNRRAHVKCRSHVVAIIQQCDTLVAERTHGRERATEPDRHRRSNVGRNQRRAGGHTDDEAEQQRTRDVDGGGPERKTGRGAALDPSHETVTRECGGAARLDPKPDLVVFPETATSGYFVEGGVKELAVTAGTLAQDLAAAYHGEGGGPPIDVVVGFYERFQNHIYNSALYVTLNKKPPEVRHVHRKVFLPTYGVFDEERFVDRGQDGVRSFETGWGGKAAILICEAGWHSLAATVAALEGAQVVIVPGASPARGLGEEEDCEGETLPASVV